MTFLRDKQSINWFLDASLYTGFHRQLAKKLLAFLEPEYTVCDIGCGLGRLDLELAPYVSALFAVDVDPAVIAILKKDAALRELLNLKAICSDAAAVKDRYDAAIMCFFGISYGDMRDCFRLCRKKLIRVVNASRKSQFYPGPSRHPHRNTVETVTKELEAQGADFHIELADIEFGQPLKSYGDAESFVRCQSPGVDGREIEDFLNNRLTKTGRADFPFYLPRKKDIGIFVVSINPDINLNQGE